MGTQALLLCQSKTKLTVKGQAEIVQAPVSVQGSWAAMDTTVTERTALRWMDRREGRSHLLRKHWGRTCQHQSAPVSPGCDPMHVTKEGKAAPGLMGPEAGELCLED